MGMSNNPRIMSIDFPEPPEEEVLKRIPPAWIHCLEERVGPCEVKYFALPMEAFEFPDDD